MSPSITETSRQRRVRDWLEAGLVKVLALGLVCLVAGMVSIPSDVTHNPSHAFQYVLILTLYLPALLCIVLRPSSFGLVWRHWTMRLVVLLLVWSAITLFWTTAPRPLDAISRSLTIILFLYSWARVTHNKPQASQLLLKTYGAIIAIAAAAAMIYYGSDIVAVERIQSFGVTNNPILAGASMAAAAVWLSCLEFERAWQNNLKRLAVIILVIFVVCTYSRSSIGGLYAGLVTTVLFCQHRHKKWLLVLVATLGVIGVAAALMGVSELVDRGTSQRFGVWHHALMLIDAHPFIGLGQAAILRFQVDHLNLTHVHNIFLQLAVELGIPALLLWLGIWFAIAWRAWQLKHTKLGLLILATWALSTFQTFFDLPHLIKSPRPEWLLTWLVVAVSFSLGARQGERKSDSS